MRLQTLIIGQIGMNDAIGFFIDIVIGIVVIVKHDGAVRVQQLVCHEEGSAVDRPVFRTVNEAQIIAGAAGIVL